MKTAFIIIENSIGIIDNELGHVSPGREIYEIDLALKELEQRPESCQVDAVVVGWIEIEGNSELYKKHCTDETMLKFDSGYKCRYGDDWPLAVATHFKIRDHI